MTTLRPLLRAIQQQQSAAAAAARAGSCSAIAPAMGELYALVGRQGGPGVVDESEVEAEVAEIMAAVAGRGWEGGSGWEGPSLGLQL